MTVPFIAASYTDILPERTAMNLPFIVESPRGKKAPAFDIKQLFLYSPWTLYTEQQERVRKEIITHQTGLIDMNNVQMRKHG